MIIVNCPECGKKLAFKNQHAGSIGSCTCGSVVQIPAAPESALSVALHKRRSGCGCLILFGILFLCFMVVGSNTGTRPAPHSKATTLIAPNPAEPALQKPKPKQASAADQPKGNPGANAEEERVRIAALPKPDPSKVVIAKRVDNIRGGPGANFPIVRKTAANEKLHYSEQNGDWYKIVVDGKTEEWVHKSVVLTLEEEEAWNSAELELQDWSLTKEYGFVKASGRVKNVSSSSLGNIWVVITLETDNGEFVSKIDGMVDFNPLLPGQTSPFDAIGTGNPAIARGYVNFKTLWGPQIPCRKK